MSGLGFAWIFVIFNSNHFFETFGEISNSCDSFFKQKKVWIFEFWKFLSKKNFEFFLVAAPFRISTRILLQILIFWKRSSINSKISHRTKKLAFVKKWRTTLNKNLNNVWTRRSLNGLKTLGINSITKINWPMPKKRIWRREFGKNWIFSNHFNFRRKFEPN